jgi:hypothetical protein
MEVKTNGGMDELVTWFKGPTFRKEMVGVVTFL